MSSRFAIALWLAMLAGSGWMLWRAPPVSQDLLYFLPRNPSTEERILVDQLRSGFPSRLVLIALAGAEPAELASASAALGRALRKAPEFERVLNGEAAWSEADTRFVMEHRYLLSPAVAPGHFDPDALRAALEARLAELGTTLGLVTKHLLAADPTGESLAMFRRLQGQAQPERRHGVWFARDGTRALLIAQTRAAGFDMDAQGRAVDRIRRAFAELANPPSMTLALSGPGPFSVEINDRITRDAEFISTLTMIAVSLFLWRVYRSLRFVLLTLLPLGSGALAGMAAVAAYSGNLNGIVLGFGSALIGFANDYPVHLFTHLNAGEPVAASIRRVWPTIRLGVLATVAGFGAMLFSGFPGLVELGVFSITGLLAAGLVCRWVMPAFLSGALNLPHWPALFGLLDRGRQAGLRALLPLGLVVLAAVNARLAMPVWDDDIAHLSPLSESSQRFDQELRAELRAPELNRIALIIGPTAEDVLQRTEALSGSLDEMVGAGALAGYDLAAHYLPSAARQLERRAVLPDPGQLRRDLSVAARGLPFRHGSFEPFVAAVTAARNQSPLELADLRETSLGLPLEPLLFPFEAQWVGLVTLGVSTAPGRLAEAVADVGGRLVDLREESTRLITRYREETLTLLSLGAVVIVLLLRAGLGAWSAALRVVLPMGLALVFTGTVIRVISGGLSLFHLVSLLLVMGLAMDYGLFFNRPPADREEHRRTQFSLLVCTMTTLLPFGLLALSQTPVLRAIGLTVSVGAASAFVLAAWLAKPEQASGA
ncbi:hypothetical protein EWI61_07440 [Methylolobus aquaticus]|nr:hypothetical protein EWI61_07440 [Methylolobus aquaticus]